MFSILIRVLTNLSAVIDEYLIRFFIIILMLMLSLILFLLNNLRQHISLMNRLNFDSLLSFLLLLLLFAIFDGTTRNEIGWISGPCQILFNKLDIFLGIIYPVGVDQIQEREVFNVKLKPSIRLFILEKFSKILDCIIRLFASLFLIEKGNHFFWDRVLKEIVFTQLQLIIHKLLEIVSKCFRNVLGVRILFHQGIVSVYLHFGVQLGYLSEVAILIYSTIQVTVFVLLSLMRLINKSLILIVFVEHYQIIQNIEMMNFLLHTIRIIYPLIQSFKVLKNKDKEGQQTLLKYWCINWMISLLDIVLEIVLNDLLVDIVLVSLAIGLIYNNFKFSAAIFNNSIQPFIYQHEKKIEQFFSFIDDKVKSVWDKSSNSIENAAKEKIGEVVADQFKKK